MKEQIYKIRRTPEFRAWFDDQTEKTKVQIDHRLSNIQYLEHFGDHKNVGDDKLKVWELRWKNGRRIYFAHVPENNVLLLLGGNKNGQNKDIRKAKSLLQKYTE